MSAKMLDDQFAVITDPATLRAKSASGSISIGLYQLARTAIQFVAQLVLARLLLPSDYGLVAMVYPVIAFVQLFANVGLGEVVIQRRQLDNARVSALFWFTMVVSIVLAGVIIACAPLVALAYGQPRVTPLLMATAATLPISALGIVPAALLMRRMRFHLSAAVEFVALATGSVITVVAAMEGFSYWSIVIGQVFAAALGTGLLWRCAQWSPEKPEVSSRLREDLGFGANLTGAQVATFLTTSGDNAIIGVVNGATALGLYERSYQLVVQPIAQAISPVSRVAVPLLSRLQDDAAEYRESYLMMLRVTLFITVPPTLICIVHPENVVALLLGSRWLDSSPIFAWISVGGLGSGLYTTLTWLFISQNRARELLRFTALSSAISLASFALGTLWGVVGVAAAGAIGFIALTIPMVVLGATSRGPIGKRELAGSCAPYALGSLVATMVSIPVATWGPDSPGWSLLLAGITVYLPFCILLAIFPMERRMLQGLARTIGANLLRSKTRSRHEDGRVHANT